MGKRILPAMIAAAVLLLPTSVLAGGEINLFYGQKELEKNDWEPVESQQAIGVELTFGHEWPVAVAIDYFRSDDDATYSYYGYTAKLETEIKEIDAGVRYLFRKDKKIVPYVGGGLAYADAEITLKEPDFGNESISDSAVGLWAAGGVNFRIGRFFNLGVDVRTSTAEVEFFDTEVDAGGLSYGVLLGFRWGGS